MWQWLKPWIRKRAQPAVVAPRRSAATSLAEGFWITTRGRLLAQGDFIQECSLPVFGPNIRIGDTAEVDVWKANVIVITQSCDLEDDKTQFGAICPIYSLDEFTRINPTFANKDKREGVRKGRHEGLHMLASPTNPGNNLEALIVDFRQIYSRPIEYLSAHSESLGDRWRLQSPYLEHFSQAFARFFMRVGLPSSIPLFK